MAVIRHAMGICGYGRAAKRQRRSYQAPGGETARGKERKLWVI